MRESTVRAMIRKWAATVEGLMLFPVPASRYSMRGVPDFCGVYRGRFVGIEAKAPDGYVSSIQKGVHARMEKAGAIIAVIRCKDDLQRLQSILECITL